MNIVSTLKEDPQDTLIDFSTLETGAYYMNDIKDAIDKFEDDFKKVQYLWREERKQYKKTMCEIQFYQDKQNKLLESQNQQSDGFLQQTNDEIVQLNEAITSKYNVQIELIKDRIKNIEEK